MTEKDLKSHNPLPKIEKGVIPKEADRSPRRGYIQIEGRDVSAS